MFRWFRRVPRYSIGIDFGTTTTRLCYFDNTQELNVPPSITPLRSLVEPLPKAYGKPLYGWRVGEDVLYRSRSYYSLFKLKIGEMSPTPLETEKPGEIIKIRPELLAARVMWELYARAVHEKDELKHIRNVTITIPAEWNAIQRQATIMAGKIAGFSNISLLEEPVAAYLAILASHQSDQVTSAKNILVFDYGGGTLDITIIHRPDRGLPYIIGRSMNAGDLAGEAIDVELAKEVIGVKEWDQLLSSEQKSLADTIRQMKEGLNLERGKTMMGAAPWPKEERYRKKNDDMLVFKEGELILRKDTLDKVLDPINDQIVKHIEAAIKHSRSPISNKTFKKEDIDIVLMVGGSSYLRRVQEEVKGYFLGKDFNKGIYLETPERIVAIGAALYSSYLDRGKKKFQLHVPMHTYLEYETKRNTFKPLDLDDYKDGRLPLKLRHPKTCPIPSDVDSINWNVYQEHTYGQTLNREIIETVKFEKVRGKADRLRLEYEINSNGILDVWKPTLIFKQNTLVETGSTRHYDWIDQNPNDLSDEYGIRIP